MWDVIVSNYREIFIGILICLISIFLYYRFYIPKKVIERYDTGEIRKIYCVLKGSGSKVGKETIYYRSGKINKEKNYINNEISGPMIIYYESGCKYIEATYKNGMLVGEYKVFEEDGQLKHIRNMDS